MKSFLSGDAQLYPQAKKQYLKVSLIGGIKKLKSSKSLLTSWRPKSLKNDQQS
jgi:hypothetical protein